MKDMKSKGSTLTGLTVEVYILHIIAHGGLDPCGGLKPGQHIGRQAALRTCGLLARIHAQLSVLAHQTEAASGAGAPRDRELLYVLKQFCEPHDLHTRLPPLCRDIWCGRPRGRTARSRSGAWSPVELPLVQLRKNTPLVHAKVQRWRLRER